MVLSMLPQVKFRAARMYHSINRAVDISELTSAGVLGLMEAVDRFDPAKGVRFQTFADLRVEGAMKDCLRKLDWATRGTRKKKKLFEQAVLKLRESLERDPTNEEVAGELGMDMEQLGRLSQEITHFSLGVVASEEEDPDGQGRLRYPLQDTRQDTPYLEVEKRELLDLLAESIRTLSEREAVVLSFYYRDELNMKEIGLVLGVTESRVSQIHNQAIMRLRSRLNSRLGPGRK